MKRLLSTCCVLALVASASAQKDIQRSLQTKFIEAEHNSVIELPEGTFQLTASLSLDGKKGIVIRGKGMDKTILNFAGQVTGAEGIKITNGADVTIEGLTVQDTKGDGIKTQLVDGITFRNVKAEWTRGPMRKMAVMDYTLYNAAG